MKLKLRELARARVNLHIVSQVVVIINVFGVVAFETTVVMWTTTTDGIVKLKLVGGLHD